MMRSSAYNRLGVLMGTSSPASDPRCLSLRGDSLPMIPLISSQGDFCATARFRTLVREVIHDLVAEVEARGHMEVLQDFAAPLPVLVIAQWLGLPQQDRQFIRQLSRHLLALDQENPDRNQAVHTAISTLVAYLTQFVEERLTTPQEDLLSALAAGEKQGSLSRDEVLGNALLLLVAGHQTTINLIGNGTLALLRHPDHWAQLTRDTALIGSATEEILRYDAPVKRAPRIAAAD